MTRRELLQEIQSALELGNVSDARKNAVWMSCEVWSCSRAALLSSGNARAASEEQKKLREMAERRAHGEPLQYILGYTDFYGLRLAASPAALIPRPETEFVVEQALKLVQGRREPRILDVGAGTGCIALALKKERPDAAVWACDVSEEALALARENAARCGLQVSFVKADVTGTEAVDELPEALDLLISNPPYIPDAEADELPREVRDYEPPQALFTGADPLHFYRHLTHLGCELLTAGGLLALETHADYAGDTAILLEEAGYGEVQIKRDLAGRPRFVAGRYLPASTNS